MLTTLRIKNLALVADLSLELPAGYIAVTGETGAGKSIILGALNLVLGERADRALIRTGSDSCSVEAVFEVSKLHAPLKSFLEENGLEPCEENQLVLRRAFASAGTNRQFINGSPTTLAVLAELGGWLVDIHGPHDHQSLLHAARQLAILDAFGGLDGEREAFAALVRRRAALESEKTALIVDEKTYAQQVDLLRHQSGEIAAARLNTDEEGRVTADYQRASNAARLLELCQSALAILGENENSLLIQSGAVGRALQELQKLDAAAGTLQGQHSQMSVLLRDLRDELSHYADKIDLNPERLQELTVRLDLIHSLKRKYGTTLAEVIAFGEQAGEKLRQLEKRDVELGRLNVELKKVDAELSRAGRELSAKRRKLIPQLSKAVTAQLKDLGFARSHFDVSLTSLEESLPPGASGWDAIEFQFAPNVGEPPRPLRAIASSGEMARVMLALKTVLARVDAVPVLVFDEVDANVGGETAARVGEKMRQIAAERQVLCITHLAPVAAKASAHYVVTKQVRDNRAISEITPLDKDERVTELARMLGGQSAAARKHAEELLS